MRSESSGTTVQTSQSSPDGWLSVECGKDVGKAYTLTVQPMS